MNNQTNNVDLKTQPIKEIRAERELYADGDWVYCEFKLQKIKEVAEDGCVKEVTTGYISHSSSDLRDRIFPLEIKVKLISENFSCISDRLHKLRANLNYPDINRYLIQQWVEACENRDNTEKIEKIYNTVNLFEEKIRDVVSEATDVRVHGVSIYR